MERCFKPHMYMKLVETMNKMTRVAHSSQKSGLEVTEP